MHKPKQNWKGAQAKHRDKHKQTYNPAQTGIQTQAHKQLYNFRPNVMYLF